MSLDFELIHVDEFIDELLHSERCCDIILPRIQKRYILEQNEALEPRMSALNDDLSDEEDEEEEEEAENSPKRAASPAQQQERGEHRAREEDRDKDRRSNRR